MARSNPKYQCSGCKARNSRNQLRGSNGICIHCKTPMSNSSWMGGQQGTLSQLMTLPIQDEAKIKRISDITGMTMAEIMSAAIQMQVTHWDPEDVNIAQTIKNGLMLAKLYRI